MNKKIICSVVFVGLFCLIHPVFGDGVTITPPEGVPTTFCALLTQIAGAVGMIIASLGGIMIVVAGILYLTSAGSPERMGTAKKALVYAIAGIVIGLSATVIVDVIKEVIGFTGETC